MVRFCFHDEDGDLIHNYDASKDLSNEIDTIKIAGPFDINKTRYEFLTTLLKRSSNKFNRITIKGMSEESPEFLAFLVLICRKASSLKFDSCQLADTATGCLMAGLLQWNGIQKLDIANHVMTARKAKLLFEGVASSRCLETFSLDADFTGCQDAGVALIHALRRNRSLKDLCVHLGSFGGNEFFPQLLQAAIQETKVKSLRVDSSYLQQLQIDVLVDILCCSDCELETLWMESVDVAVENESFEESLCQNSSVKEFWLSGTSNVGISKTIKLFNSLERISLHSNLITNLQFLDPYLVGENSTLQILDVENNSIESVEMVRFISQLHTVKNHLKGLEITENIWEDSGFDSVEAALMDAMSKNTSLEFIDVKCVEFYLALNRGGRRAFQPSESVPVRLWPELLARASKLKYYHYSNNWGHPTLDSPRSDVIFWLLNRMAPQL